MNKTLKVGNLSAEAGSKVQGFLNVTNTSHKIPVTIINGIGEGKTISITGGVHGGEYPGIETSVRLAKMFEPKHISGCLIIIHPVNLESFYAKTQYYNPIDGKNLNREFPGNALGTFTQRLAYTLSSEVFAQSDFYIDMHGGDIHEALEPFVIYSKLGKEENVKLSKEASSMLGIKYVVGSLSQNGSIGAASLMGVPGFLVEIGRDGLWSEDEVERYVSGMVNVLKHLNVLEGNPIVENVEYFDSMKGKNSEQMGLWYPTIKPGDKVKLGDKLGEISDCFSNLLGEYFASEDCLVLYVASSLSINIGDPLYAWV